jgi:hypothetical protein
MVIFQKKIAFGQKFIVPKVTVRPPSGWWTSRSVDRGGGVPGSPEKLQFGHPKPTEKARSNYPKKCNLKNKTNLLWSKLGVPPWSKNQQNK